VVGNGDLWYERVIVRVSPQQPDTGERVPRANAFARAHRSSDAKLKSGLFIPIAVSSPKCNSGA
jgi:hypothetical protein